MEVFEFAAAHCREAQFHERLSIARAWLDAEATPEPREVSRRLGRGIAAAESCVTALYLTVRFFGQPFLDLQSFIARCGGDADTIAAMAGAIWGAANGAAKLPAGVLAKLEDADRIRRVADALHALIADQPASAPADARR